MLFKWLRENRIILAEIASAKLYLGLIYKLQGVISLSLKWRMEECWGAKRV